MFNQIQTDFELHEKENKEQSVTEKENVSECI